MITLVRNKLFDWKVLPSRAYDIPLISVGNLSAGGTGKTPHVSYIAGLLHGSFRIAILSRGYKRKTRGFLLASERSTYLDIGDEPLQYKRNFKDLVVAVDESRRSGIEILSEHFPDLDAIILDDAFQHRYVNPGISILTTDFHNLYANDLLLPSGKLREFISGAGRADIIIVTKTPSVLSPITVRRITRLLKPRQHQHLFFSYVEYGELVPFNNSAIEYRLKDCRHVLIFSGIANSYPLKEYLGTIYSNVYDLDFPDHHAYKPRDILNVRKAFGDILSRNKIIITTEKDAMRLHSGELKEALKELPVFYLPIQVKIHKEDNVIFDALIKDYVRENKRSNSFSENQGSG
jgi:tetraacyldisaccharide 4'-kinase